MRLVVLLLFLPLMAACGGSPDELSGPADLVISEIKLTGEVDRQSDFVAVPISMTIRNRGGEAAGNFKFVHYFSQGSIEGIVKFTQDNNVSETYHAVNGLASGDEITVTGILQLSKLLYGEINIMAEVDTCGDEVNPAQYCLVNESDENNNFSEELLADVPPIKVLVQDPPQTPQIPIEIIKF